ncbi:MAG: hypothetical protein GXO43_07695 [Crenarchaeota archaeon]|nr:hypothetical protein [Thermoproteota archaeon]
MSDYMELTRRLEIVSNYGKELRKAISSSDPVSLIRENHWKPIMELEIMSIEELCNKLRNALSNANHELKLKITRSLPGLSQLISSRVEILSKASFPLVLSIEKDNINIASRWINTIHYLTSKRQLMLEEAVLLLTIIPEHEYTHDITTSLLKYIKSIKKEGEKSNIIKQKESNERKHKDDRLEVKELLTPVEVKGKLPEFIDVIKGTIFEIPSSNKGDLLLVSKKAAEILKEKGGLGNPIDR